MKSVADLKVGESAVVIKVLTRGDKKVRVNEMGITQGAVISVNRKAPLGDPIEIEVRGYKLCIRAKDAKEIIIGDKAEGENETKTVDETQA